ncbi:MAG: GerMN domain-containing protein [Cyanobacteria bacterium LVE1205-1]|jgi:spore germination protein GerM
MHNSPTSNYKSKSKSIPPWFLAGLSTLVIATGVISAWIDPHPVPPNTQTPTKLANESSDQKLAIYWLKDQDGQLKLKTTPLLLKNSTKSTSIKEALQILLAGPSSTDLQNGSASTIPLNTKLLDLQIRSNPGDEEIYVNLSSEFTDGGGSTAMIGRLAQVLYTATSLDSKAEVWISVDGKPLTQLGGEGVLISQPMTRQAFTDDFQL